MSRLVILVAVTSLNFGLGLIVLTKNPRHWVNRSFSLFAISVACWSGAQVTNLLGVEPAVFGSRFVLSHFPVLQQPPTNQTLRPDRPLCAGRLPSINRLSVGSCLRYQHS